MGPIWEVAGPIPENVVNVDMFKGAMESDPPSPRSTCGVPLTTLRPFSEIENALALGLKAGCAFNARC